MTRTLDRLPDSVVRALDDWRLWVGVAYFALAAVVIWLAVITTQTAHTAATTAKEQAIRQATIKADYRSCVRSIPTLAAFSQFIGGVNELAGILVQNSVAALSAAPADDPLNPTRRDNIKRLEHARGKIAAVTSLPVPTIRACSARRQQAEAG